VRERTGAALEAVTNYIDAAGIRIAEVRDGVVRYLHTDMLGSTSLVTSDMTVATPEPQQLNAFVYEPFGSITEGSVTNNRYTFTGKEYETATGYYDYTARLYDPALGRFISPDSIVPNYANPQALNRYSYVYNNPLRFNDPTGHVPDEPANGSANDELRRERAVEEIRAYRERKAQAAAAHRIDIQWYLAAPQREAEESRTMLIDGARFVLSSSGRPDEIRMAIQLLREIGGPNLSWVRLIDVEKAAAQYREKRVNQQIQGDTRPIWRNVKPVDAAEPPPVSSDFAGAAITG